jgi:hypothetical protein
MSRGLSTDSINALTASVVRPAFLIEASFDSGTLRMWNGSYTLSYDGNDWLGAGTLLAVGDVGDSSDTQATNFTASITGVPLEMLAIALGENYQGREIKLILATLDDSGKVIDAFTPFIGKMDVMTIQEEATTATIAISCESEFIRMLKPKVRRLTSAHQKARYSGDKFFDYVPSLANKTFEWGRKQ